VYKLTYSLMAAVLAYALAACGGQPAAVPTAAPTAPPTQAPTATPIPTDTPVPTNTPPPATPTPASASAGSSSAAAGEVEQAIAAGLEQVQSASAYRVELEMAATGNLGMGAPAQGAGGPVALISLAGDVAGEDSRLTLKGLFSAFLGANPDQGLELITVDGASYVRGPAPLLGATEAQWYELPADGSSPASAVRSDQIVGGLVGADLDLSGFEAAGEETLDGQRCQVYVGDKEATTRAFEAVGDQGLPGPQSFEEVTRAELKFWICEDGYFHQLALDTEGVPEGQTEPVGYTLTMRLFDFDADITVEAPADAEQLESIAVPGLPTPTP
jgi:hypothetical protein